MAQMLLDDLVDVVLVDIGVPGFFRVHDDAGALLAALQTTRLVDAHSAFAGESELFHTLLGGVAQLARALVVAAAAFAVALVAAEKNVVGVIAHVRDRSKGTRLNNLPSAGMATPATAEL